MTEEKVTFLTKEGYERLKAELEYLRTVRRREVAEHIRQAKLDGDISENAGYDEAKNEQAFVEGRILTLENLLRNAVLIDEEAERDTVELGAWVTIVEEGVEEAEEERFQIVGSAEANPMEGKISSASPVGQALMGHRAGDVVRVRTPGGERKFRIVRVE